MITRPNFGLNYQGYDPSKPPPVGFITERRNSGRVNHLARGGFPSIASGKERRMMDPLDPSTWQRSYQFTT